MWYIGQDIVSVIDQPDGAFKEGQLFVVRKIRKCPCRCGTLQIYVGLHGNCRDKMCVHSGKEYRENRAFRFWHNELFFMPLDDMVDISEMVAMINKPRSLVN